MVAPHNVYSIEFLAPLFCHKQVKTYVCQWKRPLKRLALAEQLGGERQPDLAPAVTALAGWATACRQCSPPFAKGLVGARGEGYWRDDGIRMLREQDRLPTTLRGRHPWPVEPLDGHRPLQSKNGAGSLPRASCPEKHRSGSRVSLLRSMLLNALRLFVIEHGQFAAGTSLSPQKLVELCMNGLGVAMLSALNDEGHEPGGHSRRRVPVKALGIEKNPNGDIAADDEKCGRVRRENAKLSQPDPYQGHGVDSRDARPNARA